MELLVAVMAMVIALLGGIGIGWGLSGRRMSAAADTADSLRLMLDGVTAERDAARIEVARLESTIVERERSFEQQKAVLAQAKDILSAQFGEIGQKLLGEAQAAFLQRADERFNQAGDKNEERLKQLLAPVGDRLKAYEEQVGKIEKDRSEAYGTLTSLIDQMRTGQERVSTETAKLVSSLRNAPKARGRWGEQQLKNVLESCGLSEHVDFLMEVSVETDEGRLRPDCVIKIPGGRTLLVDAKVSFNDYQDAFAADDDVAREAALKRHFHSMKNHVNGLGSKAYQTQFGDAPDYVVMFVGGEHFLAAALEHDSELWDYAFARKVLIATPTNLVAIARTVASVWQQESLAANAREIAELGKVMHERLAKAAEEYKKVGRGLAGAVNAYNSFTNSFENRLMVTGRKFEQLNIEKGTRELEVLPHVEVLPRYGDDAEPSLITDERDAAE
jgi:DNA recombination protein RmuC